MKTCLILCIVGSVLLSCKKRSVTPAPPPDLLTTTIWCDKGGTSYRFEATGSFNMRNASGKTWGGNWFYRQPLTDVEINLRHGPNRQIQLIRLRLTERTATRVSGIWTDEIAKEIPVSWQACVPTPN